MKINPADLQIPAENRRTKDNRDDIQASHLIVQLVSEDHLLHSTEGYLAVLRGIQYGRLQERAKLRDLFLNIISDANLWRENVDGDTDSAGRTVMYIDYDLGIGQMSLEELTEALGIKRGYTESLKDAIDRAAQEPVMSENGEAMPK